MTGSRTVEPRQHHSTQENGPSNASRCVGGRLSSAGRCGFGPGVHETLKQVQALYAQMIGSADRAEQAVKRMDVAIARMEGLERRIDAAYNALDQAIKSETQHWSRTPPIRERFGGIGEGVARGLRLRHDHGSNYLADDFQQEVAFFGIESSPSFVREPEGNGVAERFIRTLKENLLWVRSFATIEELRLALLAFKRTYNEQWMLEKYDYRKAPPRCDATSSGWTRQRRSEYRQTTVQEPWGSTVRLYAALLFAVGVLLWAQGNLLMADYGLLTG